MEGFPFVFHRFNITAERMETRRDPDFGVRSVTVTSSSGTETGKWLEEAVGRILYPEGRRPFIWAVRYHTARAANPGTSPTRGGMRGQTTLGPPIRPCSAWGLPCPLRFQRSGALLPHPFTLTLDRLEGGLLSAALSLALPRPGVTRHVVRLESGPSSTKDANRSLRQPPSAANARLL